MFLAAEIAEKIFLATDENQMHTDVNAIEICLYLCASDLYLWQNAFPCVSEAALDSFRGVINNPG